MLTLRLLVLTSGMAVMAVEMTGLRLLAPFFGTSLMVTTILIGSMMAFLSLGYWLGGRRADRDPTLRSLSRVTGAAALLVLLIPLLGQPVLRLAASTLQPLLKGDQLSEPTTAIATIVGGLLGTLALFALPVTLMGMVSPWAVRLAVHEVQDAGRAAGRLYALSTFGSIIGSFLPALVLVPLLGVRNTFFFVGGLLLAVSAAGYVGRASAAAVGALAWLLAALPQGLIRPVEGLILERESLYHFIQVVEEPYGSCKRAYHLYLNEGVGIHSVKCATEDAETRGYWAFVAAAPLYMAEPAHAKDVLVIGLAGGTLVRHLQDAVPGLQIDGVEIDGAVVEVGEQYFDNHAAGLRSYVMDGRVFLQATDRQYDVVVIDAYRQPYIPFHLTTLEFWEEVHRHLREDSVVAINVASVRGGDPELAQMIYRTMREVFPAVHVVDVPPSNQVLFATRAPSDKERLARNVAAWPRSRSLDQIRAVLPKRTLAEVPGWRQAQILTDDQAPVELAWEKMALAFIR